MIADPILDALVRTLPGDWRGGELFIGSNWTLATVVDPYGGQHAGLAASPDSAEFDSQTQFSPGPLNVSDQAALSLVHYAYSANPVAAAVGLASLNALLQPPPNSLEDIDAGDWLVAHGRDQKVALVGHFPFIDELRPVVRHLWVLELDPRPGLTPRELPRVADQIFERDADQRSVSDTNDPRSDYEIHLSIGMHALQFGRY